MTDKVRHKEALLGFQLYELARARLGNGSDNFERYCNRWYLDHNPALLYTRQFYATNLYRALNWPSETMAEFGLSGVDWMLAVLKLDSILRLNGLCTDQEISKMYPQMGLSGIEPDYWHSGGKYLTYKNAKDRAQEGAIKGEVWGLIHGDADPAHYGHLRLTGLMSLYCDKVLWGFDPPGIQRKRKGDWKRGDERPRFPIEYRMWHMAALGAIEGVFVMPLIGLEDWEFVEIYRQLGIGVLGCGASNSLKVEFARRMELLGGDLVVNPLLRYSSTEMMARYSDVGYEPMDPIRMISGDEVEMTCKMARSAGYPYD